MPEESVRPFLQDIISTPDDYRGIWSFEISPKITVHHKQPLQKMPPGALSYELRMQRRASTDNPQDFAKIFSITEALVPRLQALGGKIYPPYCPVLSKEQWQEHYGAETWQRFARAKNQFDPDNVLTPGAGLF